MAMSLRKYLNSKMKEKGISLAQAKKGAGKYKSIAAAKKAGSLYYTDKNGKVQAAVYAGDLEKSMSSSLRPKARPKKGPEVAKTASQSKVTTNRLSDTKGGRGSGTIEMVKRKLDQKSPQNKARDAEIAKKKFGKGVRRTLLDVKNPFLKDDKAKASKWKTWFAKNKNKYMKPNGNFDMSKAMKDFRKIN